MAEPLPTLTKGPITSKMLATYARESRDPNPIHLDEAAAKRAGLPGVIAHGMLSMAFLAEFAQVAVARLGGGRIAELRCRFKAMTLLGDVISISGVIASREGRMVRLDAIAKSSRGETTCTAEISIELAQ